MNKPLLLERDFDPYASISENVSVRRNIAKFSAFHVSESRLGNEMLKSREPLQKPFDAKQNLRTVRAETIDRQSADAAMLAMATEAVGRQQNLTRDELVARVEILSTDLSKIFD
jgi:hypothetical protein